MRIAVISDIHGNLEAFSAVLKDIDIDRNKVDAIISLGDNIGYGADSEAVIQQMIDCNITSILGNHELACVNDKVYKWYIGDVKKSIDMTMAMLSKSSLEYLNSLKINLSLHDAFFVHGFWPDSVRHYLHQMEPSKLIHALREIKESMCFLGHTHQLGLVFPQDGDVRIQKMKQGTICLKKDKKYMVNVGSVGQSRDKDPHAKYVIWDLLNHLLDIRYVRYDNTKAAQKIIAAGLPLKYAMAVNQDIKL
ncbi:MAG: metallophosphoesterase family protein [Pseudomonadota bacterium]